MQGTVIFLQCVHCKTTVQGYTVFKFYPLSLKYRDPAASPLNARQYMFKNQAITLINRQLSWLTGSSFFFGKDSVDIFEKNEILFKNTIV